MYHFERSVSLTHMTLKKKNRKENIIRKNLTTQHYNPGWVGVGISVFPGSRVQ